MMTLAQYVTIRGTAFQLAKVIDDLARRLYDSGRLPSEYYALEVLPFVVHDPPKAEFPALYFRVNPPIPTAMTDPPGEHLAASPHLICRNTDYLFGWGNVRNTFGHTAQVSLWYFPQNQKQIEWLWGEIMAELQRLRFLDSSDITQTVDVPVEKRKIADRQREVKKLREEGRTIVEIAFQLAVGESTVKADLRALGMVRKRSKSTKT